MYMNETEPIYDLITGRRLKGKHSLHEYQKERPDKAKMDMEFIPELAADMEDSQR